MLISVPESFSSFIFSICKLNSIFSPSILSAIFTTQCILIYSLPLSIDIGLKNLDSLILAHNQLSKVPANVFSHLTQLNSLELEGNQITYVDKDAFAGLEGKFKQTNEKKNTYFWVRPVASLKCRLFTDEMEPIKYLNRNEEKWPKFLSQIFQKKTYGWVQNDWCAIKMGTCRIGVCL